MLRIQKLRADSRRMLKLLIPLLREFVNYGSLFTALMEWPRSCDGWNPEKCPEITQICELLPHVGFFDGCTLGVRNEKGELVRKRYRVQSSCPATAHAVSRVCHRRLVKHGAIGGRTTVLTGFYNKQTAKHMRKALTPTYWVRRNKNNKRDS